MKNILALIVLCSVIFSGNLHIASEANGTVTVMDVSRIAYRDDWRYGEPFQHIDKVYILCTFLTDEGEVWSMGLCEVILATGGAFEPRLIESTAAGLAEREIEAAGGVKGHFRDNVIQRANAYLLEQTGQVINPEIVEFPEAGDKHEKLIFLIEHGSIYRNGQLISLY